MPRKRPSFSLLLLLRVPHYPWISEAATAHAFASRKVAERATSSRSTCSSAVGLPVLASSCLYSTYPTCGSSSTTSFVPIQSESDPRGTVGSDGTPRPCGGRARLLRLVSHDVLRSHPFSDAIPRFPTAWVPTSLVSPACDTENLRVRAKHSQHEQSTRSTSPNGRKCLVSFGPALHLTPSLNRRAWTRLPTEGLAPG